MLKGVLIENLYNFKDEIILDFTTRDKEAKHYGFKNNKGVVKDMISNFSIIYGKNNVGKSNLLKIIHQAVHFIKNGKMELEPYKPTKDIDDSTFEIILQNDKNEIRYGFTLNIPHKKIVDEWLYAKIEKRSRETKLFSRSEKYLALDLKKFKSTLSDLRNERLFLNLLSQLDSDVTIIKDFFTEIDGIHLFDSNPLDDSMNGEIINLLLNIGEKKDTFDIMNKFLNCLDLDLKGIKIDKLDENEADFIKKFNELFEAGELQNQERASEFIGNNYEVITKIFNKNIISSNQEFSIIEFIHESGFAFDYKSLSTGTKQMINIITSLFSNLNNNCTLLFDEIELGLHMDLVESIFKYFKDACEIFPMAQFIITTHRGGLLDMNFIPDDNKIFIKKGKDKKITIDHVSEYTLNKNQEISKRYAMNAFDTNPDLYSEYEYQDILREMRDTRD